MRAFAPPNPAGRAPVKRTAFALLVVLLAVGKTAHADARTEARKHFKTGMERVGRGQYEAGIAELERAYEILPHPDVLFNIARAYAEEGELEKALAAYRRYLDASPADAEEVTKVVAQLQARLDRQRAAQASPPAVDAATANGQTGAASAPPAAGAATGTALTPPLTPTGPTPEAPAGPGPAAAGPTARGEDAFRETVVTASRTAQSPLDAPNSTSVITEQDIRLSGLTKVPELLRRLAGVDVNTMTGGDTEVSVRGFNSRLSNKTLVLIDYRSVYLDLLGATFWESFPIDVEQIERIEVVRGTGSALYGADAFAGVINIITKAPGEGKSSVRVGGGDHATAFFSTTATGRDGDNAYRVSAGYTRDPRWSREATADRQDLVFARRERDTADTNARFDLQFTRRIDKDTTFAVGGGYARVFDLVQGTGSIFEYDLDGYFADAEASLTSKHFNVRTFYSRVELDTSVDHDYSTASLLQSHATANTFDTQAEWTEKFATGEVAHDTHLGLEYRVKQADWSYLDAARVENWFGVFGQETARFGERVQAVASLRADYVPYLATFVPSPRGSLIYKPTTQSALRLSGSTAYRAPSFIESYFNLVVPSPAAPGAASLTQSARDDQGGAFKLARERVASVDLGYLNQDFDAVNFELTGYYSQVAGLITLAATRPETVSTYPLYGVDRETGRLLAASSGWENQCLTYHDFGAEAGARVYPYEGIDLFANYTLSAQNVDRPGGCNDLVNQQTSRHKVNVGAQYRSPLGVDGELTLHYSSAQTWAERVPTTQGTSLAWVQLPVSPYTLVNARVGYRFLRNAAEVSATAYNLLNQVHQEHPFGEAVGRRFMGFFTYRF